MPYTKQLCAGTYLFIQVDDLEKVFVGDLYLLPPYFVIDMREGRKMSHQQFQVVIKSETDPADFNLNFTCKDRSIWIRNEYLVDIQDPEIATLIRKLNLGYKFI